MSTQSRLKSLVENIPESVGRPLSNVPFSLRLGPVYGRMVRAIKRCERAEVAVRNEELFQQLRALLRYAQENVEFYREFYERADFDVGDFRDLDDWHRVPVVTRADLQRVPLEKRCAPKAGAKFNTGGTSGQPLEFCLDRHAFAREWAHMHYLWEARGYRPQHLKLTLRGKRFDVAQPLRYNAVHNEYVVNANCPVRQAVEAVLALPRSTVIRWVHGYPSLVAEFAHAWEQHAPLELAGFRDRLFGALLGSEYPAPIYRSVIEDVLTTNVVSWYGQSEMAILARETASDIYESLPTYGYTEAIATGNANEHRLVSTSLHNRVHPFIRYDTGDLVEPLSMQGGSLAFRISEGRVGDFVVDRQGNRHSLTAIIFGRHHESFELLQHLQVRDEGEGKVTIVMTSRHDATSIDTLRRGFDLDDLDIDWRFDLTDEPIRTPAGKICLKLR